MAKKVAIESESSAEEKIKTAARKLFTQKGFAAVKTRDIAGEAGINLALLNYYFRSKEKLFDIIMLEHIQQFLQGLFVIFNDETTSIEEKIELLASKYIDTLTLQPDIPIFILSEIRSNPKSLADTIGQKTQIMDSYFMKQIQEAAQSGKIKPIHPLHFISNMVGLTVFPFVARPILNNVGKINQEEFNALMQERKKLIPVWIKAMLELK
jgi:AcrR family transcriptional regulator